MDGQGRYQSREIDLAEQAGILGKRACCIRQAGGEILPKAYTRHVEYRLRYIIRGNTGYSAEHDHVHEDGEQGRNEVPRHTEYRLLELNDYIALDKQPNEVLLFPEFLES